MKDTTMSVKVFKERSTKCIVQQGKSKKKFVSIQEIDDTKLVSTVKNCK